MLDDCQCEPAATQATAKRGGRLPMIDASAPQPELPIGLYALDFSQTSPQAADGFPGNHWRGALGTTLRDLACVTGASSCEGCRQKHACAYAYLYETPPPADAQKMRRYDSAPHPFTLRETAGPAGVRLVLSLFGRGNAYLPLMVLALRRAALTRRGIGGRRFTLAQVWQAQPEEASEWTRIDGEAGTLTPLAVQTAGRPPPCPVDTVELRLLSPLRVKHDGRLVEPKDFQFADFFGNLLRRLSMLTYFHTDTSLETDFKGLMERARATTCDAQLQWIEQSRHSSRQKQEMPFGGLTGTIRLAGTDIAPLWPFLWLGQYTHAGAGATMGLGYYSLASLSQPASTHPVA